MSYLSGPQSKFSIAISRVAFVEKPGRDLDWETFNTSFDNCDLDMMTFCDRIYRGFSFCPWMNGKRKVENFILAQHIAVDMDGGDHRSSIEALVDHPLVLQFGAVIYETPSHTKAHPRSRVVFFLDEPIRTAEGYKAALETVYTLFDGADPSCVDAARFFYGNGRLGFYHYTDGIWFSERPLLPLADLRRMARQQRLAQRQTTQAGREAQRQTPPTPRERDKMTLVELEHRLDRVDAYALDYKTWLKVVAAIRHEYGDAAFGVAKRWSDKPGKKPLTEKKWHTLNDEHPQPATMGTIIQVLQEHAR